MFYGRSTVKPGIQFGLVAVLFLAVGNGHAEACQCAERPTRELRDRSAVVFRGVVTKIAQLREPSPTNPGHTRFGVVFTFRVRESLKGNLDRHVVVRSGECEASSGMVCGDSCTAKLDLDEEYLVFATTAIEGLTMSQCSAHRGEPARRRLRELRELSSSHAPQNNALHLTGRGGVAIRSMRPIVEARPAGERECYAGNSGCLR